MDPRLQTVAEDPLSTAAALVRDMDEQLEPPLPPNDDDVDDGTGDY